MEKSAEQIVSEIKQIDNNVTAVIVPMLKDTIEDYRKIVFKLIFIIVFLIMGIIGISIVSQVIISKQIDKYNEFLSQFECESTEVYQTTDDYSDINSGINVNK